MKSYFDYLTLPVFLFAIFAQAAIQTKTVQYKQGDTTLEGFLAWPKRTGKFPGVVVVHDWMGLGDYAKKRTQQLAELGYVAFAADIYGKGVRPKDGGEAGKLAGQYKGDRPLLRARVQAAYDELAKLDTVKKDKIAAIGYCFGGTTALELARSGADLAGVISFHGGLSTPQPADAKNIKAKVLVLHGADDPNVPEKEVLDFQKEMRDAKVDWQMIAYGGAVHSFSNPGAGNDNSTGNAYNEKADKRSWEDMKQFFKEIF